MHNSNSSSNRSSNSPQSSPPMTQTKPCGVTIPSHSPSSLSLSISTTTTTLDSRDRLKETTTTLNCNDQKTSPLLLNKSPRTPLSTLNNISFERSKQIIKCPSPDSVMAILDVPAKEEGDSCYYDDDDNNTFTNNHHKPLSIKHLPIPTNELTGSDHHQIITPNETSLSAIDETFMDPNTSAGIKTERKKSTMELISNDLMMDTQENPVHVSVQAAQKGEQDEHQDQEENEEAQVDLHALQHNQDDNDSTSSSTSCQSHCHRRHRRISFADEKGLPLMHIRIMQGPQVHRLVILILSPQDRTFEFVHVEYPLDTSTTVQVLLEQLPHLVAHPVFRQQTLGCLAKLPRSNTNTRQPNGNNNVYQDDDDNNSSCSTSSSTLPCGKKHLAHNAPLASCQLKEDELILGVVKGHTVMEIAAFAKSLLRNQRIARAVAHAKRLRKGLKTIQSGVEWQQTMLQQQKEGELACDHDHPKDGGEEHCTQRPAGNESKVTRKSVEKVLVPSENTIDLSTTSRTVNQDRDDREDNKDNHDDDNRCNENMSTSTVLESYKHSTYQCDSGRMWRIASSVVEDLVEWESELELEIEDSNVEETENECPDTNLTFQEQSTMKDDDTASSSSTSSLDTEASALTCTGLSMHDLVNANNNNDDDDEENGISEKVVFWIHAISIATAGYLTMANIV